MQPPTKKRGAEGAERGFRPVNLTEIVEKASDLAEKHFPDDSSVIVENTFDAMFSEKLIPESLTLFMDPMTEKMIYHGFMDFDLRTAEAEKIASFSLGFISDFLERTGYGDIATQGFRQGWASFIGNTLVQNHNSIRERKGNEEENKEYILRFEYTFSPRILYLKISSPQDVNVTRDNNVVSMMRFDELGSDPEKIIKDAHGNTRSILFSQDIGGQLQPDYKVNDNNMLIFLLGRLSNAISNANKSFSKQDYASATASLLDFLEIYEFAWFRKNVFTGYVPHYMDELREMVIDLASSYGSFDSMRGTFAQKGIAGKKVAIVMDKEYAGLLLDYERIVEAMNSSIERIKSARRMLMKEAGIPSYSVPPLPEKFLIQMPYQTASKTEGSQTDQPQTLNMRLI